MEWINTKDKSAPLYEALLAFHKRHGIVYAYRWQKYEQEDDDPAEYAWELKEGNSIPGHDSIMMWSEHLSGQDEDVTHWMPLPLPPRI